MSQGDYRSNEELVAFRKKHFLHTANHYHKVPLQLVKASGVHVWDSEGKKYLDAIGGIVCISAGHNHPKIKKAMLEMIESDTIQHTSVLYLTEYSVDAAEKLLSEAPEGIDRCSFTNSGSEANELAFMTARHSTGENMIVNLRHGYHGGTSGTQAACGHSNWRFKSQPVAGVTSAEAPNCYRCPFGKKPDSCGLECADNVESTIQTSTHGAIAGFVAEPVMGVGGFITPPDEYFHKVAKIVHKYGGRYISDEVQTGAGRSGENFLLTKTIGIDADMVTMAKGLGNGAAVGATLMKSADSESLAGRHYFNTFGGDAYQMMQTKLTMDIIDEEGLLANAKEMGVLLRDGLKQLQKNHSLIGDVRGRGLLLGMELVRDLKTKEYATEECARFLDLCKDQGILTGKGGLFNNVIRIAPPLSVNKEQINEILTVFDQSLHALKKEFTQ